MTTRNKNFKNLLLFLVIGIILTVVLTNDIFGIAFKYVEAAKTDHIFPASEIVNDYLTDAKKSDEKYFEEEGYPKVLKISGTIAELYENFKGEKVVLLKAKNAKAGIIATFMDNSNLLVKDLESGDEIVVKGVIEAGAYFDTDLDKYEDVILDKSEMISVK